MNQFRDKKIINGDSLKFEDWERIDDKLDSKIPQIRLKGEIACQGTILITVDKYLDILEGTGDDALVQTVSYAYNASVQGVGNILRYDNQDDYFVNHYNHPDKHHKHIFNWCTNEQNFDNLKWVGFDNWLTLGQVIEELEIWYWNNINDLSKYIKDPNSYAILNLRD